VGALCEVRGDLRFIVVFPFFRKYRIGFSLLVFCFADLDCSGVAAVRAAAGEQAAEARTE
jgi:hypothetical protein